MFNNKINKKNVFQHSNSALLQKFVSRNLNQSYNFESNSTGSITPNDKSSNKKLDSKNDVNQNSDYKELTNPNENNKLVNKS